MKQAITTDQWNELSDEDGIELAMSLIQDETPALPNIGQMIDFIGDTWCISKNGRVEIPNNEMLCDRLWELVKYELVKKS